MGYELDSSNKNNLLFLFETATSYGDFNNVIPVIFYGTSYVVSDESEQRAGLFRIVPDLPTTTNTNHNTDQYSSSSMVGTSTTMTAIDTINFNEHSDGLLSVFIAGRFIYA